MKEKASSIITLSCNKKTMLQYSIDITNKLNTVRNSIFHNNKDLSQIFIPRYLSLSYNDISNFGLNTNVVMDSSIYRKVDIAAGIVFLDVYNFINLISKKSKYILYYYDGMYYKVPLRESKNKYAKSNYVKGIGSHIESMQRSRYLQKKVIEMLKCHKATYIMLTIEAPAINKQKKSKLGISKFMTFDLSLPGGSLDCGETPLECIERELEEETGICFDTKSKFRVCRNIPYYYFGRNTKFNLSKYSKTPCSWRLFS
jgi:hypothetical protein